MRRRQAAACAPAVSASAVELRRRHEEDADQGQGEGAPLEEGEDGARRTRRWPRPSMKPSVVKSIQACSTMQRISVPDTRRVM